MKAPTFFCRLFVLVVISGSVMSTIAEARLQRRCPTYRPRPLNRYTLGPEISLIQGNTLEGWTTNSGKTPPPAWSVEDGVLQLKGKGGLIMTDRDFENYILDFTWTIAKGGNSGIKYRFQQFEGKGWLGPEYQILDDYNTGEGKKPKNSAATLYDIKPTNDRKRLNPHTEKNSGRIVVHGDKLEHWLNGEKVVEIRAGSAEWNELVAQSKFNNVEGFGLNALGRIMLQDHGCDVWFHEIFIREIVDATPAPKGRATSGYRRNYKGYKTMRPARICTIKKASGPTRCVIKGYKPASRGPVHGMLRNPRCCR